MNFSGFIPALVTPFYKKKVDFVSLEKYIQFLCSNGMETLLVNGSTGEFPTLTDDEKFEIINCVIDCTKQKNVKIICGIIEASTEKCVNLIKKFNKIAKIDAFLCIVPFYIKPNESGLINHYFQLSNAAQKPILLYNNPSRCGIEMSENAFCEIAKFENICGIKECSTDITRFVRFQKYCKDDFSLLSGNDDTALAAFNYGAMGCVSVLANAMPRFCCCIYQNWMNNDMAKFLQYAGKFVQAVTSLQKYTSPCAIKYLLKSLEVLRDDEVRAPLAQLSDEQKTKLSSYFRECEFFVN